MRLNANKNDTPNLDRDCGYGGATVNGEIQYPISAARHALAIRAMLNDLDLDSMTQPWGSGPSEGLSEGRVQRDPATLKSEKGSHDQDGGVPAQEILNP